jgi:hypothetical protein
LVMYRPGRSGGLPLAADFYCDRNAGPAEGPRCITRGRWPEEPVATRRLGGSAEFLLDRGPIVRLRLHGHPWAKRPKVLRQVCLCCRVVNRRKISRPDRFFQTLTAGRDLLVRASRAHRSRAPCAVASNKWRSRSEQDKSMITACFIGVLAQMQS